MSESFGQVEALLFVSSGLISIGQIAKALEISESEVEKKLQTLDAHYKEHGHGLRLMWVKSRGAIDDSTRAEPHD